MKTKLFPRAVAVTAMVVMSAGKFVAEAAEVPICLAPEIEASNAGYLAELVAKESKVDEQGDWAVAIPRETIDALCHGLATVTNGMSKSDVRSVMGNPDVEMQTPHKAHRSRWGTSSFRYYIKKRSPSLVNVNDWDLTFCFTSEDVIDTISFSRNGRIDQIRIRPYAACK